MGRASAWAETSVKPADGGYPPVAGDRCAGCGRELLRGQRVYKLTSSADDEWTCESCLSKPDPEAARNGMGI